MKKTASRRPRRRMKPAVPRGRSREPNRVSPKLCSVPITLSASRSYSASARIRSRTTEYPVRSRRCGSVGLQHPRIQPRPASLPSAASPPILQKPGDSPDIAPAPAGMRPRRSAAYLASAPWVPAPRLPGADKTAARYSSQRPLGLDRRLQYLEGFVEFLRCKQNLPLSSFRHHQRRRRIPVSSPSTL